ncbi:MAG: hypothetical protein CMJ25_10330 [Phycisphaerae bacterium]|nr:hypothetical protein [Phycisphaerae bacterium]|tara:strand:- start:44 stop:223 length:180 start_codon:yes stop_codon:yes gene_type:complete
MNNTQKIIERNQAKQRQGLNEWLNDYKSKLAQYNEPQRIAHRKEISDYLQQVGRYFNLR